MLIKNKKNCISRFIFSLILILCVISFSCKKSRNTAAIRFDDSEPLALAPDVTWALVTDPYAAFRIDMDWQSENSGHVRRGEILQVLGKSVDDDDNVWYKFESGWLPASCLSVYSNRMKAQTAKNQLTE